MKNSDISSPEEDNPAQISAINGAALDDHLTVHSLADQLPNLQANSPVPPQTVSKTVISSEVNGEHIQEEEESGRSRALKTILLIMTVLLGVSSLILGITFYILGAESSLDPLLLSLNLSLLALVVGVVLFVICVVAVWLILKKITIGLHFYWLLCLIATAILILLAFSAVGVSFNTSECIDPTSYFLSQTQLVSSSGQALFCSTECPCPSGNYSKNGTVYQNIIDCPNWQPNYYSELLQALEEAYECTGWCSPVGMSMFAQIFFESNSSVSCFASLEQYVNNQSLTLKVVGGIVSTLLISIILIVNCYIFSIVQDEDKHQLRCKQESKLQETTPHVDGALATRETNQVKIDCLTDTKRKLTDTTRKVRKIRRRLKKSAGQQKDGKKESCENKKESCENKKESCENKKESCENKKQSCENKKQSCENKDQI